MKQAISGLFSSKKAIVYVVTVGVMAGIIFGGVDPDHAADFVDKLSKLAMAYLGGQGLADLGKYAGQAYASGKKAVAERDSNPGDWKDRVAEAGDVAQDAGEKAGEAAEAAASGNDVATIPPPPKIGA